MQHDGVSLGHELDGDLDHQQDERRHERDDEREEHDVRRRRAAHREELGVLAEDVEERLRQRESGHGKELSAAHRRLAEPVDGAVLARLRVIEDACSTGELLRALDLEPFSERALEGLTIVVGMGARPSCA